jgi:ribosomal protein S18 acetylase RimI-like enzyme
MNKSTPPKVFHPNRSADKKSTLRDMRKEDIDRVVDIHLAAFQNFFLSFLGPRFLHCYYSCILEFQQIGMVATDSENIVGFAAGIDNGSGIYRKMLLGRGHEFVLAAIPALIRRPNIWMRLVRALWKKPIQENDCTVSITLTSIAVVLDKQGMGIGQELMDSFKELSKKRGASRIVLDTDADENDRVCRFYEREGFKIRNTYRTPEGRRMHEFTLDL